MAQVAHVAVEYARTHTQTTREWRDASQHLVVLSVADEKELETLSDTALSLGFMVEDFFEPDLGDSLTATAMQHRRPWTTQEDANRLLSSLPLAGKEVTT